MGGLTSRIGFRGRLVTAMVALVSLLIGALMMVYLFEDENRHALEQLTIAERLTTEVLERRTDLELSRLNVVVRDFGFRSAIASGDPATLNSALENHSGRVDADFALLLDSQGQLLASTLTQKAPDINEMQLATARKNGAARSLLTIDRRGYEMLVIPIEAPGLRAWLVAGFELDQELADIITRLSGSSVIFRASPNGPGGFINFATSSDIDSTEDPALNRTESNQNFIKSDRYFTRMLDLGGFGQISFEAVLLTSQEASRQNYYSRALEIALLVTVIMALAILLALLTARHLGRPVLQLADYARAVGHGDNPPAPDIRTGGELRQLRDTLGLAFGDKVLLGLSQRLRDELPDAGIIARTGGGEFLTLIPQLGPEALDLQAQALHNTVEAPRNIENTPFSLRTHLITMQLPADASNTSELRRRVNLTFEHAFRQGVAVTRYERGRDEDHLRELKLVSDLHSAVRNNGLHMNYQPKLDNGTGQLLQVEALVRWIHPELG